MNTSFCQRLKEAVDLSSTTGDEELTGVNVGRIFIQAMPMLQVESCSCSKLGPETHQIDLRRLVGLCSFAYAYSRLLAGLRGVLHQAGGLLDAARHHGEGEGAPQGLPQGDLSAFDGF